MFRALGSALAWVGVLSTLLSARSASGDQPSTRARDLPAPSASEAGWFGLSVGIGAPTVETTLGSGEPSEAVEGKAGSAGNYRLLYEKQVIGWLGLRGFMSSTEWGTALSTRSGDGDRALYDLGGAPVLSWAPAKGRVSLFVFAPVSFSWSSAPARAKRQVVLESMDVGTGYRVGLGLGMLVRLSSGLGLLVELEASRQQVSHVRRYARLDGSGPEVELPIGYDLRWLGLAFFP